MQNKTQRGHTCDKAVLLWQLEQQLPQPDECTWGEGEPRPSDDARMMFKASDGTPETAGGRQRDQASGNSWKSTVFLFWGRDSETSGGDVGMRGISTG